jgi:hypothetical protein
MKKANLPIIQKEILLEIEKTFRTIWDKERKTEALFKKATVLHEQVQTLLAQELCKPENEQNSEAIAALYQRLADSEEAIDTVSELTGELRELRNYFYGLMSEPQDVGQ